MNKRGIIIFHFMYSFSLLFSFKWYTHFYRYCPVLKKKNMILYRMHFIWGPFHELCLKDWNKKKNPQLHFFFVAAFPLRSCGLIMTHFFTQQTTIDHWIVRFPNFKVHLLQKWHLKSKYFIKVEGHCCIQVLAKSLIRLGNYFSIGNEQFSNFVEWELCTLL